MVYDMIYLTAIG